MQILFQMDDNMLVGFSTWDGPGLHLAPENPHVKKGAEEYHSVTVSKENLSKSYSLFPPPLTNF